MAVALSLCGSVDPLEPGRRMRVVHVCNGHDADDVRVYHRECRSLAEAGYDVHLIAAPAYSKSDGDAGVSVHDLPRARSRAHRFGRSLRIAKMAHEIRPDLFHVHEPD